MEKKQKFSIWYVFVGIWFLFMKRMSGQQPGFLSLGKNKAKIYMQNELNVTFDDVAGVDEAKQELVEVIEFLKEPGKSTKLRGKIPREYCWLVRLVPAKPCWQKPLPEKVVSPFSA